MSVLFVGCVSACVPSGSAPPYDAGAQPTAAATIRPSLNVMTAPFEDNFDRADDGGKESAWPAFEAGIAAEGGVALGHREDGGHHDAGGNALLSMIQDGGSDASSTPEHLVDHGNLGPNWTQVKTNAWHVEN